MVEDEGGWACLKVIYFDASIYWWAGSFIIFMRGRYEGAEEEAEGFELAELAHEDHYIIVNNLEESQQPHGHDNKRLPNKKRRLHNLEKPRIKFAALELLPLSSRNRNDSQKCLKSLSLQKTNTFDEASTLQLPPPKQNRRQDRPDPRGQSVQEIIEAAIVRTKRYSSSDVGLRTDENQQLSKMKDSPAGQALVFKKRPPKTTHEAFREITRFASASFLGSKYNGLLRARLEKYEGKAEERTVRYAGEVSFEAAGESCNLQCAARDSSGAYNLTLSVDTNTRGHQNWFYFAVTNNRPEHQRITININIRRRLPMVRNGQGVYCRRAEQWERIEVEVQNGEKGRFRLTFQLDLAQSQRVEVSLLPPYTYSDQLSDIQTYEQSPNARVDILTYSLAGLAIPLLTLTKGARSGQPSKNRSLYLLSARIHPSQTCGSYIINALIRELLTSQYDDFLAQNVLKIVPMLNPDGVVLGNFRTNYLGNDLNRSFHSSDEALFPETVALKELGRKCKEEFGDRFLGLLDLHGHSSQPNSFIYGPEYPPNSESYVECRVLPKILDRVSSVFSYASSSFRLEEYKYNTARGFFSRKLKVPAYTIETSYALYCPKDEEETYCPLGIAEWEELGRHIAASLRINHQCLSLAQEQKESKLEAEKPKRRAKSNYKISNEQPAVFARLTQAKNTYAKMKLDILQEIKNEAERKEQKAAETGSDSDGEGEEEDLSAEERALIIRRMGETVRREANRGKSMLPPVAKETILSPSLPASLIPTFYIGSDAREGILQRMNSKFRNRRYNRPVNISQEYTEYLLRNITGASLKPEVVSFNPKVCRPN